MIDVCFTKELEDSRYNFIEKGWLPLYRRLSLKDEESDINVFHHIFCYLIEDNALARCIDSYLNDIEDTDRVISPEDKFKKGVITLITVKNFHLSGYNRVSYVDIAEELVSVLYLMEEARSKQDREYFYIDDNGTKDSVIKVTENEVLIKQDYLNKYLLFKQMHLCSYFRFEAETKLQNPATEYFIPTEGGDAGIEEKTPVYIHNNLVRPIFMPQLYQSWQTGKSVIRYTELSDIDPISTVEFIVDLDKRTGEHIKRSCRCDESEFYKMVYFEKTVMDKYYSDGTCKVTATKLCAEFFSMRIDNDSSDFVGVYLKDLCCLPIRELKYWQAHNIAPNENTKQSRSFDLTMNKGCWNAPIEQIDLAFKEQYNQFNRRWVDKFGWHLFKPLDKIQESSFTRLYIPQNCSKVQFDTQIQSLALILVDSINVEELKKIIESTEKDKAIDMLSKYLFRNKVASDEIIDYLRCLQTLRSKITTAHRYSRSSSLNKSLAHFSINPDLSNLQDGIRQIFSLGITMLNKLDSTITIS